MASTSETGHAKNIANLKSLNEINAGFGANYKPSNSLLDLAAMQAQQATCDELLKAVNTQEGILKPIIHARQQEFKSLGPLVRKVRSAARSCGGDDAWLKDVNMAVTKVLGERISKAKATEKDPAGTSTSQQSCDSVLNNFQKLIEILKNEPLYAPNETALQIATLEAKYAAMETANNEVKAGVVPYNNAVIARNKALYMEKTGLCDVGQTSKDYIRSTFGFSSPEFKLVTKIKFTKSVKLS